MIETMQTLRMKIEKKGNLSKLLKRSPLEARISFHPSVFAKSSVIGM